MALRLAGPDAEPLIAAPPLRGLTAFATAVGGLLVAGVIVLGALFAGAPLWVAAGVAVGGCLLLTAAVIAGGWDSGVRGAVERVAAALLALSCLAVAVYGAAVALTRWQQLPTIGTAPSHLGWPLAGAAIALLALTLMAVVLPLGRGGARRWVAATAAATALLGLAAGGGSVAAFDSAADAGCSRFDFQPSRWQAALADGGDDLLHMAEAIERCGVVAPGTTRARALALLGRPQSASDGSWSWTVGGPAGFSFGTYLSVILTADRQRVASVYYYVD